MEEEADVTVVEPAAYVACGLSCLPPYASVPPSSAPAAAYSPTLYAGAPEDGPPTCQCGGNGPLQTRRWEPLFRFAATETRLERLKLVLALVGLPCSVGMAVWGALVHSFNFEITGLAGLLIGASGEAGSRSYSLLDLGLALRAAMAPASSAGRTVLIAEFLLLHLITPMALPFAVALLWALPLPLPMQRQTYLATQLVNAVSGIDIFMLALAVGLSELERLGQFLLKGRCDELNKLLALYALELLDGDPRCFSVSAGLEQGYWVLLTAAIVSFVASRLILRRCELALFRGSARTQMEAQSARCNLASFKCKRKPRRRKRG